MGELETCGSLKDAVQKECETNLEFAKERVRQIEEAKRKEDERKAAEAQKLKEMAEKAEQLCTEFSNLLLDVEGAVTTFSAEAEPLMPSAGQEMCLTLDQINSTASACESSGDEAKDKLKKAKDFFTTN